MEIHSLTQDKRMKRLLKDRVARYERRYEMHSREMLAALSDGMERETADKLRWMFDYHALELLDDKTRTDGTAGSPTSSSTKSVSLTTLS